MQRSSPTEWAEHIKRWKASGLTAKEYAAETGVNASSLSKWSWKLRARTGGGDQGSERGGEPGRKVAGKPVRRSDTRAAAAAFVEVPMVVTGEPAELELVLGGDVSVRVRSGFDEATLTRLVRAVEAAR